MDIECLWELYRETTRKAFELEKEYKRQKKEEKPYSGLTYIELNDVRSRAAGITRCIEALAPDKHEVWRREFEIWQEENELPPEGEFGLWTPAKKKKQPDGAGFPCLVSAVNIFGQKTVFEAFTGYGEKPFNQWCTLDKTKGGEGEKVHECWKITAWMPLPPPYDGDEESEEEDNGES